MLNPTEITDKMMDKDYFSQWLGIEFYNFRFNYLGHNMTKYVSLFLLLTLSSCVTPYETIVNVPKIETPYKSVLIVIPHFEIREPIFNSISESTTRIATDLKRELNTQLGVHKKGAEILLIETWRGLLTINDNDTTNIKINDLIERKNKDLLITFNPHQTGGSRSELIHYEIVATDTSTKREVWIGKCVIRNSRGSMTAQMAQIIIENLVLDNVL